MAGAPYPPPLIRALLGSIANSFLHLPMATFAVLWPAEEKFSLGGLWTRPLRSKKNSSIPTYRIPTNFLFYFSFLCNFFLLFFFTFFFIFTFYESNIKKKITLILLFIYLFFFLENLTWKKNPQNTCQYK